MVKSLSYIKSLDSSIATCLVVPDLPEHMNVGSKNEIYKKVKDIATPMLYDEMSKYYKAHSRLRCLQTDLYNICNLVNPHVDL